MMLIVQVHQNTNHKVRVFECMPSWISLNGFYLSLKQCMQIFSSNRSLERQMGLTRGYNGNMWMKLLNCSITSKASSQNWIKLLSKYEQALEKKSKDCLTTLKLHRKTDKQKNQVLKTVRMDEKLIVLWPVTHIYRPCKWLRFGPSTSLNNPTPMSISNQSNQAQPYKSVWVFKPLCASQGRWNML